ncbi:MAG: hypothetical protein ACPL0C_06280 [Candidatus Bathyarchaeales archaeon]
MKNGVIAVVMLLALLFAGITTFVGKIKPTEAENGGKIIYINADGSITPQEANITRTDDVIYTFNGTNSYPIVVNRSNIIIDGNCFAVQGKKEYGSFGISLYKLINVTIANVTVRDFCYGIKLNETTSIEILESTFNNTCYNIWGYDTYKTIISGNYITGGNCGLDFSFSFRTLFLEITSLETLMLA